MRDVMRHRGPDGAGVWGCGHVVLAHRRLAVIDPTPAGAQPMVTPDGRYAIAYNGELYNDAEVRAELEGEGVRFGTQADTETVLWALATWGAAGLGRLRGMYALGFCDVATGQVLLARDPLGIKPLYYAVVRVGGGEELVFASEPRAILAHPRMSARPDLAGISAYLTTIRTVMGSRTLFEGVRVLRPGQVLELDLSGAMVGIRSSEVRADRVADGGACTGDGAADRVRACIEDSVGRHLRSDVPICCLLSGGLDSSIIATLAMRRLGGLHTYCSGAPGSSDGDDFAFARNVAGALGTAHTEAPVSRALFKERWQDMVRALGIPLSTPNEVAINEVARTLRGQGKIVTLSGEGADELFGGYESPMLEAAAFEGVPGGERRRGGQHPGEFQLEANSWIPREAKGAVLAPEVWKAFEGDAALRAFYRDEFDAVGDGAEGEPIERVQAHLRFHRRINLAGLLQRLDTATMLAGVEGRTPFADAAVCGLAEGLRMEEKFVPGGVGACETKRVLRRAFAANLPRDVVARKKESFPLPFQEWVADQAGVLRSSALAREIFTEAAIESVAADAGRLWRLSWPMVNVAMWGRVWWG